MLKSTTASTRAEDGEEDEEVEGKSRAGEEDAMASTESERVGGGGCFGGGGGERRVLCWARVSSFLSPSFFSLFPPLPSVGPVVDCGRPGPLNDGLSAARQ